MFCKKKKHPTSGDSEVWRVERDYPHLSTGTTHIPDVHIHLRVCACVCVCVYVCVYITIVY